jgi:hypothetical protein
MRLDGSIHLFDYWNRLRDGRPAPRRTEIEPADIKSLLADTFILERDSRGAAVFRLAGTRLCAIHGRELKGFSFPSLWRARDQRMIARLTQSVFTGSDVVVITYDGISQTLRKIGFELLLLPLEGGDDHQRALGIISSATRPYWLGADPISDATIDSVRVVDPDREPMFLKNRPAVSVPALSPTDLVPPRIDIMQHGARRIRHLVVLPGGREGP